MPLMQATGPDELEHSQAVHTITQPSVGTCTLVRTFRKFNHWYVPGMPQVQPSLGTHTTDDEMNTHQAKRGGIVLCGTFGMIITLLE